MPDEKIHEYQCKLQCLCVVASYAAKEVLGFLSLQSDISKQLRHTDPKKAFSAIIKKFPGFKKKVKALKYNGNKQKVYVKKNEVKEDIDINSFDLTLIHEFLTNIPAFPLCGTSYCPNVTSSSSINHDVTTCVETKVCCAICLNCKKCKKFCNYNSVCTNLKFVIELRNREAHLEYSECEKIEAEEGSQGKLAKDWNKNMAKWEKGIVGLLDFLKSSGLITQKTHTTKNIIVQTVVNFEKEKYWAHFADTPELILLQKPMKNKRLEVKFDCSSEFSKLKDVKNLNSQDSKIFQVNFELLGRKLLQRDLDLDDISEKCLIDMDTMKFECSPDACQVKNSMCICAIFHIKGRQNFVPDSFNSMTSKKSEKLRSELTDVFKKELCKTLLVDVKVDCVGWEFHSIHIHFEVYVKSNVSNILRGDVESALTNIARIPQVTEILASNDLDQCNVNISFRDDSVCESKEILLIGFNIVIYDEVLVERLENILPSVEKKYQYVILKLQDNLGETSIGEALQELLNRKNDEKTKKDLVKNQEHTSSPEAHVVPPVSSKAFPNKIFLKQDIYSYVVESDDIDTDQTKSLYTNIANSVVVQYPRIFPDAPLCDGETWYTKQPLPSSQIELLVTYTEDGVEKEMKVTLTLNGQVKLADLQQAIKSMRKKTGLTVVLQHIKLLRYRPIGSTYVTSSGAVNVGLIWKPWATYSSVTPVKCWKINFMSNESFDRNITVIEYLNELTGYDATKSTRHLNKNARKILSRHIKGFKVQLTYNDDNTQLFVNDVMFKRPEEISFIFGKAPTAKCYTIEEFFQEERNVKLKYPYLPCLHVGDVNSKTYIPMELCKLVCSAKRIMVSIKEPKYSSEDVEETEYAGLRKPVVIKSWGLVVHNVDPPVSEQDVEKFQTALMKASKSIGLMLGRPTYCETYGQNITAEMVICEAFRRDRAIDFVIVVMKGPSPLYGKLKNICEMELGYRLIADKEIKSIFKERGLVTQGIKWKNFLECKVEALESLCLQICEKIGAVVSLQERPKLTRPLQIFQEPIIFIGASITIPSDDFKMAVASIVSSIDHQPMRYQTIVKLQNREKNIIVDLVEAIKECLWQFWMSLGVKPSKIVFYRIRVPDHQLSRVLNSELFGIQQACHALDKDYQPGITFIALKRKPLISKMMPASDYDEYTHAGFQESTPYIYRVLWDDNEFPVEQLKELSMFLCHMHIQFKRFFSTPAPCYYAYLIGERMKYYFMTSGKHIYDENLQKFKKKNSVDVTEFVKNHPALAEKFK